LMPRPDPIAESLPLVAWIGLAALIVAAGHVLDAVAIHLQQMVGDRLTVRLGDAVIQAANRWPGIARFEDPAYADDLERTRTRAGQAGLSIMVNGAAGILHVGTVIGVVALLSGLHPLAPILLLVASAPAALLW